MLMSDELIAELLAKRRDLLEQVQGLHSNIYRLNEAMRLHGHNPGQALAARMRFRNGELIALLGQAERGGLTTSGDIITHII
jgi:hypothetical protein